MKFGIFSDLHLEFAPYTMTVDPDVFYLNAENTAPTAPDWYMKAESRIEAVE